MKTYCYRLYPTKKQVTCLKHTLEICRWVYNNALAIRKNAWEIENQNVSYFETQRQLPIWKREKPELKTVHSQVLQDVTKRVDLAFQSFFRRVKSGSDKAGYPRFKGYGRYDSITYPQSGFHVKPNQNVLHASKIGDIPIILHRPLDGEVKTLTIRRTSTDKWYACFSVEIPDSDRETLSNDRVVGIDVGLTTFCTMSDGTVVENPRWFRNDEKKLATSQRKLSKLEKGTPKRRKQRKTVAHIHERIANKRKDFIYKLSNKLSSTYGTIVFEDLNIKNMMKNHCLAKSIGDAAWSLLISTTVNKAEEAGCTVVLVNPKHTSQICSQCGQLVKKTLSDRIHNCLHCGLSMNRDLNASINIMRLGLQSLG